MTLSSVSGVLALFQVEVLNLTRLEATDSEGFIVRVSGVSGLSRAQACTHSNK